MAARQNPLEIDFPLQRAYEFLRANRLEDQAKEIAGSRDRYMSYQPTLKRGKIIVLLRESGKYEQFLDEIWPYGRTDQGVKRASFCVNVYHRFLSANSESEEEIRDEEAAIEELVEEGFKRESELRDFLANNLHAIEPGLELVQTEYVIPGYSRRIDIYCTDSDGTPVIIELKVYRGHERVIGQSIVYQQMIKKQQGELKVRVIIIAKEISDELRIGALALPDFELYQYQISMTLNRVIE